MVTHCDSEHQRVVAGWQRAKMIKGVNPDHHRIDCAGRMIAWNDYDNRQSRFGWTLKPYEPRPSANDFENYEAIHFKTEETFNDEN